MLSCGGPESCGTDWKKYTNNMTYDVTFFSGSFSASAASSCIKAMAFTGAIAANMGCAPLPMLCQSDCMTVSAPPATPTTTTTTTTTTLSTMWNTWTSWSSCSATCGGGSYSRSRQCYDPMLPGIVATTNCMGISTDT